MTLIDPFEALAVFSEAFDCPEANGPAKCRKTLHLFVSRCSGIL
jgi:hypothetical protein